MGSWGILGFFFFFFFFEAEMSTKVLGKSGVA